MSSVSSCWLVLDKPPAMTSHDVVNRARRKLGLKRIGHSGTLDPDATGVLVLAINKATRLIQFLPGDKAYRATIRLGVTTDTQDASGRILAQCEPVPLSREHLLTVLAGFTGAQLQIPPMVSAVSHQGQRLYQLARQGIEVVRPARPVTIHELKLVALDFPCFTLEVYCSKGTYIRTLAHDIGVRLGCGAHLQTLRRIAANGFNAGQAMPLEAFQAAALEAIPRYGLDFPLGHLPELQLDAGQARRFWHGQRLEIAAEHPLLRVYSPERELLGLAEGGGGLIPRVVLTES